jgi:hypothetical protein
MRVNRELLDKSEEKLARMKFLRLNFYCLLHWLTSNKTGLQMADFLIRHLEKKGTEHSALKMLVNQWGFDQQLIPKALQTVGHMFPHYSRHDESHSKQILVNIERLLGDNINLLTATDTWLILEAAYWHDIGMVVPKKDIESAFENPKFLDYIEAIRNDPRHELYKFCRVFDPVDVSKCFSGVYSPIDAIDQFKFLMAEWFRREHPTRGEIIVRSPQDSVGISSPRTELIPGRLFKLLGRICKMHGAPFASLFDDNGLPFREAGLAQEDCHPRFVACLLRMGDLLDMDDNRFCPVMKNIAGENRPGLSKAHEDKHAAMRHLRIDREFIEVYAECETIEGYLETFKWFDWLKQEMQDQMGNWQSIVPDRALGLLPTLGPISVRLSGRLQILNEGQRPQFSVDSTKAKELLQGSNLYSDKYACVREILQNAVDATLLAVWLKHENHSEFDWNTPDADVAREALHNAMVRIQLIEMQTESSGDSRWVLRVTDQGTGISREDLNYMLSIGGSHRNMRRQKKIGSMPEWMKPSGTFGIGFQSIFLICGEVNVLTKSIFSNETLRIVMHSPTQDKEGLVLLESIENDIAQRWGTTIEIPLSINDDGIYALDSGGHTPVTSIVRRKSDPLVDQNIPDEIALLADRIHQFSKHSLVKISAQVVALDGVEINLDDLQMVGDESQEWRFVKVGDHQVKIHYGPTIRSEWYDNISAYYRGQLFESECYISPHVKINIDVMSGKAGAWLTASRDKLAGSASDAFKDMVLAALARVVKDDIESKSEAFFNKDVLPLFSYFLQTMARYHAGVWKGFAASLNDEWLDLPWAKGKRAIRSYFDKDVWILGSGERYEIWQPKCDMLADGLNLSIIFDKWRSDVKGSVKVIDYLEIGTNRASADDGSRDRQLLYRMSREPQELFTNSALSTALAGFSFRTVSNRRAKIVMNDDSWAALHLRKDIQVPVDNLFKTVPQDRNFIVLPFLFRQARVDGCSVDYESSIDTLCKWVQPNLATPLSFVALRKKYDEFCGYIDDTIMRPSRFWESWKADRGL